MQVALSEKVGLTIRSLSTFVTGFVIAFFMGWDMTLVLLGCIPLMAILGGAIGKTIARSSAAQNSAYAQASDVAQQSIAQVRTVVSYTREEAMQKKYSATLDAPMKAAIHQAWLQGAAFGGFQVCHRCHVIWVVPACGPCQRVGRASVWAVSDGQVTRDRTWPRSIMQQL